MGWAARRGPEEPKEKLPDVNVTDDIFAIRRAFEEAERLGKREAARSSSGGGSGSRDEAP